MQENRAVFDANIWISFFLNSKMKEIVAMMVNGGIDIFRCKDLTDELNDVLNRPKIQKNLSHTVKDCINIYELSTTSVRISHKFTGCRDPKDNYLFDLAVSANAKYIVSGDRDVRETKNDLGVETVSLTRFKEILRNRNN